VPNRILKESICTSESLSQLSWFEQVFFDHLIVNCDDYGRMDARPAILKAKLFPLNVVTFQEIESGLQNLVNVGCVRLYESDGKPFLYLPSWSKHQSVRAKKSKYPAPENIIPTDDDACKHLHADESKCPRNPIQSYSYSNAYSEAESNPNENENPPVVPQGTSEREEIQSNQSDLEQQSESLTVETAQGAGEEKPVDHSTTSVQQERFKEFWRHYPRKVGKGAAEKAWDKIKPGKALLSLILSALDQQKACEQWKRENGRYIPNPATWLNQKRWEDDIGMEDAPDPDGSSAESGAPPGDPPELPPDIARAKQRHDEAMKRFMAGECGWEELVPE